MFNNDRRIPKMALKKPDGMRKEVAVVVPMTVSDKARLLEMAQARGVTTAQFVRGIVFNREHELIAA
jgi:hypothetical protein